jgi:hypothetical protein
MALSVVHSNAKCDFQLRHGCFYNHTKLSKSQEIYSNEIKNVSEDQNVQLLSVIVDHACRSPLLAADGQLLSNTGRIHNSFEFTSHRYVIYLR